MNKERKEAIAKNSLRYYREHREEINKKRRERHAIDEEYREKINRQKRESRKRCKERQQQELDKYKNIVDELEKYIKTDAKIEIYGDKTGLRTFVDGQNLLDKLKELKGSDSNEI